MVKSSQILKFGRDLAKKDPKITSGKVAKLWNILQNFRRDFEAQSVNLKKRGSLLDLTI